MTQAGDAIVALLWGGISTRPNANANLTVVQGLATDINAVMSAMQIDIATTNTAGQIITVPATNVLAAPAPASPPAPVPAHARRILDAARRDIEATEHGRVYAEVFRRNHEEVWGLVRDNRRVGAIWKRHGGQAILQAVLDAVDRPDKPIPATVKSRPLSECAARIASILRRFGSAALGRDLDRYEQLVGALPGSSYMQHLARLRAGEAIGG
jgi:hypothetical protein